MSTYHDLLSKLQELRIILPNHSNKFNEILLKLNGFLKIKNSSNNFEGTYDFCQYIDQQLNALKNLIGNNESFNNLVNFWYKERDNISTSIFKYFKGEMVEQTSIQSEKLVTKQILQETHFVFSPILKNILDTEANCISADKQSASSKIFVEKISILTQQINKFIEQADAQTILSPVQRRLVIARNLLREHVAELQIKQPAAGSLEASILLMQENNLNQLNKKIESFEQAIDPVSLEVILALIRPEKSVPIQNQSQSLQPSIALNTNRAPSINSSLDIGPRLIKLLVTAIGHEQTYRRSIEINLSASLFTLQSTKDMAENRKKISSLQEEQLNQLQNKTQTSPITEELVTEINNNFINHLNKINELGKDGKFVNEDQLFKQAYIKLQQKLIEKKTPQELFEKTISIENQHYDELSTLSFDRRNRCKLSLDHLKKISQEYTDKNELLKFLLTHVLDRIDGKGEFADQGLNLDQPIENVKLLNSLNYHIIDHARRYYSEIYQEIFEKRYANNALQIDQPSIANNLTPTTTGTDNFTNLITRKKFITLVWEGEYKHTSMEYIANFHETLEKTINENISQSTILNNTLKMLPTSVETLSLINKINSINLDLQKFKEQLNTQQAPAWSKATTWTEFMHGNVVGGGITPSIFEGGINKILSELSKLLADILKTHSIESLGDNLYTRLKTLEEAAINTQMDIANLYKKAGQAPAPATPVESISVNNSSNTVKSSPSGRGRGTGRYSTIKQPASLTVTISPEDDILRDVSQRAEEINSDSTIMPEKANNIPSRGINPQGMRPRGRSMSTNPRGRGSGPNQVINPANVRGTINRGGRGRGNQAPLATAPSLAGENLDSELTQNKATAQNK